MGTRQLAGLSDAELDSHRHALTGYCYRMLGSPFDAEDAVQETMVRAWRARERFEGRASVRGWLFRIATNVCNDALRARGRRALPMDLGPSGEPVVENLRVRDDIPWVEPARSRTLVAEGADPAEIAAARASMRLAFVVALQHLPPRQRAALILKDALNWSVAEIAELLDSSTAAINSALQRARATLDARQPGAPGIAAADPDLLARYVAAFERYDIDALTDLLHEDATQAMPPYDLWLSGRHDILTWWFGPGLGCRGSRLIDAGSFNGTCAFAQYKPADGGHLEPWALQVVEVDGPRIANVVFFLETSRLFPMLGLPSRLAADAGGGITAPNAGRPAPAPAR